MQSKRFPDFALTVLSELDYAVDTLDPWSYLLHKKEEIKTKLLQNDVHNKK